MKRGKILLLLVCLILVMSDGILLANFLVKGDVHHVLPTLVRLGLTVVLLAFVYMGFTWARVILVLLVTAALIYVAVIAFTLGSLFMWILVALLAFVDYVVGLSPSVRKFLEEQRA